MDSTYRETVVAKLAALLSALEPPERADEMKECERVAEDSGYLNSSPRRGDPVLFSLDLLVHDPGMNLLVEKDCKYRLAMSAESPAALVSNLLPSDGHLD